MMIYQVIFPLRRRGYNAAPERRADMVVLQRNEVSRSRLIFFLTISLSVLTLVGVGVSFSGTSDASRVLLVLLGALAAAAMLLCLIQLYAHPKRSQVLVFQSEDGLIIAINVLHEGFKLRFLRDILGEQV